jgi:hypothetical protein
VLGRHLAAAIPGLQLVGCLGGRGGGATLVRPERPTNWPAVLRAQKRMRAARK